MDNPFMEIYGILLGEYGEQGWWPIGGRYNKGFKKREKRSEEKLEVCIGAILAQNTSWKNAERAILNLRGAGVLEQEKLLKMREAELAVFIKPAGYYNLKARKIREFLKYSGGISRAGLLSIWGCGEETVDSILLYAYNVPVFVADMYSRRIFYRVGLCRENAGYGELRGMLNPSLPSDYRVFNEYHALLVEHAKRHCRANPLCEGCVLAEVCKKKGIKRRRGK